uniref:Uncharacterized protein n=1 Tax=Globisporangium ultimum (strain ATCC 200006 / CBS 805.95 / DAOM BR144) TaxID=431595 RepID=K3W809_GLOUD
MVRIIKWTLLLVAACAAAARAQDQPPQTCVEPSVVTDFEAKIQALEASNADVHTRLDAASKAWAGEKKELESKLEKEQAGHRSTVTLLRNTKANSDKTVALLEKKLEDADARHKEQLSALDSQVQSLEATVDSLKSDLAKQKEIVSVRDSEVSDARAKLLKFTDKVKSLEKDVQLSRKNNEALRSELEQKETEISLSALLSSYYDEGVVVAGSTVALLRERAEQSSGTINKVVDSFETTKKTVVETTDKFYAENLAATVDPILADIREAADPHVKKYLPIVQQEAEKAKTEAIKLSQEGLQRAKSARLEAIALLEQNENVATYAQKIVDGVLIAVAIPLVLFQIRFLLRVVWWLLSTAICVMTFGCCCSSKRSKLKRKTNSRKTVTATAAAPAASTTAATSTLKKNNQSNPPLSSANKRNGKKNAR